MITIARIRTARATALCALALAGCHAPPDRLGDGDRAAGAALAGSAEQDPAGPAAAFRAWAYGLPESTTLPPMRGRIRFRAHGDLAEMTGQDLASMDLPVGADSGFTMNFEGELQIESWSRIRAEMDMSMELGPLKPQSAEPLVVGLLIVADGETVWIEPDWSQAWFLDQLRGQATGFERLVFTIEDSTIAEFLEAVSGMMEEAGAEWYRESIQCAANPARLARLLADHVQVDGFERGDGRIRADLTMDLQHWLPGWSPSAELPQGLDRPLRYRCEFDAATGAVLRTSYEFALDEGLSMEFLQEMEIAREPFPAESFTYALPEGRRVFPVDLFVKPVLASIRMETGQRPPDRTAGDLPF